LTTHSIEDKTESLPWYRYPMVWMIILLPLIAVVASIATFIIASDNAPLLLEDQQTSELQKNSE